jgi:hypothetical protein
MSQPDGELQISRGEIVMPLAATHLIAPKTLKAGSRWRGHPITHEPRTNGPTTKTVPKPAEEV